MREVLEVVAWGLGAVADRRERWGGLEKAEGAEMLSHGETVLTGRLAPPRRACCCREPAALADLAIRAGGRRAEGARQRFKGRISKRLPHKPR